MKLLLIKAAILLLMLLSAHAFGQNNQFARNLEESFALIKDPGNRATFELQMTGEDDQRWTQLGVIEPSHPLYMTILRSLGDIAFLKHPLQHIRVGFQPIPYWPDHFLAWVHKDHYVLSPKASSRAELRLGVFSKLPNQWMVPHPYIKPLKTLRFGEDEAFKNFDWAPYELTDLGRAVGVRSYRWSCGAGGSVCWNDLLRLVTLKAPVIREVFIARVGYFGNYGGEWNIMDGTREHIVLELNGSVSVASLSKNPPDIVVEARLDKRLLKRRFVWSKRRDGTLHYETKDREIFPRVDQAETLLDPPWARR